MKNLFQLLLVVSVTLPACISTYKVDKTSARDNNVCRELKGKVLVVPIFVNTRYSDAWTEYDRTSAYDSIEKALNWIGSQSLFYGQKIKTQLIELKTETEFYKTLPSKRIEHSIMDDDVVRKLNRWSKHVSNQVNYYLNIAEEGTKGLTNYFRSYYKTDNVVLLFMINNYLQKDASVAVNTSSEEYPEFAIITDKNPSTIAHETLHLFGATDLYLSEQLKRKSFVSISENYSTDIMYNPWLPIEYCTIDAYTRYLIGWDNYSPEFDDIVEGRTLIVFRK